MQEEREQQKDLLIKDTKKIFSDRLRLLREEKKMTQAQLAKKICLTTSSIQKFELQERFPSGIDLIMLSNIFDVSIDYLIGKSENRKVEYASFDELGLQTKAIDTLRELNTLVYKNKKLDAKALLTLDTLNLLLSKRNSNILYSLGNILLIKKTFDNYFARTLKKKNDFTKYSAYELYTFKLMKAIDSFCEDNSSKCLTQALIKNIDNEEDLQKLYSQIDALEDEITRNPKDYFYTPTEQKILFDKNNDI